MGIACAIPVSSDFAADGKNRVFVGYPCFCAATHECYATSFCPTPNPTPQPTPHPTFAPVTSEQHCVPDVEECTFYCDGDGRVCDNNIFSGSFMCVCDTDEGYDCFCEDGNCAIRRPPRSRRETRRTPLFVGYQNGFCPMSAQTPRPTPYPTFAPVTPEQHCVEDTEECSLWCDGEGRICDSFLFGGRCVCDVDEGYDCYCEDGNCSCAGVIARTPVTSALCVASLISVASR